jgi:hypothetical protein
MRERLLPLPIIVLKTGDLVLTVTFTVTYDDKTVGALEYLRHLKAGIIDILNCSIIGHVQQLSALPSGNPDDDSCFKNRSRDITRREPSVSILPESKGESSWNPSMPDNRLDERFVSLRDQLKSKNFGRAFQPTHQLRIFTAKAIRRTLPIDLNEFVPQNAWHRVGALDAMFGRW